MVTDRGENRAPPPASTAKTNNACQIKFELLQPEHTNSTPDISPAKEDARLCMRGAQPTPATQTTKRNAHQSPRDYSTITIRAALTGRTISRLKLHSAPSGSRRDCGSATSCSYSPVFLRLSLASFNASHILPYGQRVAILFGSAKITSTGSSLPALLVFDRCDDPPQGRCGSSRGVRYMLVPRSIKDPGEGMTPGLRGRRSRIGGIVSGRPTHQNGKP